MDYISTFDVAKKWEISPRRVLHLVKSGRIPGVTKIGTRFMIPEDAEKPIDGRTKLAKSFANEEIHFRYPIFEHQDVNSFHPPLSKEELLLKCVFETVHACRFQEADTLLGNLPEKTQDKYIRITALYVGCMTDIFLCHTKRFFDRYNRLANELHDDFPYKTEMQEYLHEIDAALGLSNYYVNEFKVKPNYPYHPSFLPHLASLSTIRLAFPNAKLTVEELVAHEVSCIFLEQGKGFVYTQATHVYLAAGYVLVGMLDKANYHFNKALILAEKYELYYIPAEQYPYMKNMLKHSLDGFSDTFRERFLQVCDDVYCRYTHFTESVVKNYLNDTLSYEDFIFVYYAVKRYPNKEIAQLLNLSESNISKQYGKIYSVLGVKNKAELAKLYQKLVMTAE